jgi:tetratricopeptide (TPR) repeat protein
MTEGPSTPTFSLRRRLPAGLLVALVLALAVRALFWSQARDLTLVQEPTGDAATYIQLAHELLADGPAAPAGRPYERAPLYPFLLWGLFGLGFGLPAVRVFQFALGVAGVALLWILGRRLAGRTGGLTAALGGALYGPFIFFEAEFLSISIVVFLLEAALVLWGRRRGALAAGVLLGFCALAQPNFLVAGGLAAAVSVLRPRLMGWNGRRAAILLAVGLCLPPLFTLVRNWTASGEPVPIAVNGGINFFIGNNPASDGTFRIPSDSGLVDRAEGLFISAREVAEGSAGRPLSAAAVDRYWWTRGFDYWLADAGRAFGLTLGKAVLAVNRAEIPSHYDYAYFAEHVPVLRALPAMGLLFPLGALGLGLAWRRRTLYPGVFFLAFLLSVIPFFITARYRLPLAVFLWPAAGLALHSLWRLRRTPATLAVLAGAVGAYAVLANFSLYNPGAGQAHMRSLEAIALVEKGDLAGARTVLENALARGANSPEVLGTMASVCEMQGDGDAAAGYYERAVAANPGYTEAYLGLEGIYRRTGRNTEALAALDRFVAARGGRIADKTGAVAIRRGLNRLALGDSAAAEADLRAAVAAEPSLVEGWLALAYLDRARHRPEQAVAEAEKAVAAAPGSPQVLLAYGDILEGTGRLKEAAVAYSRGIQQGPPNPELSTRLGRLLARLGHPDQAEPHLLVANRGAPYPPALWELGQLYEEAGRLDDAATAYTALIKLNAPQADDARERLAAVNTKRRERGR